MTMFVVAYLLLLLYGFAIPSKALNGYALGFGILNVATGFCAGVLAESKKDKSNYSDEEDNENEP